MHVYKSTAGVWAEAAGSPVALGHTSQAGGTPPEAAGIAISDDGTKIVVTNYENDSISVLTQTAGVWSKTSDYDLRPGIENPALSGIPGGAYPFWVVDCEKQHGLCFVHARSRDRRSKHHQCRGALPHNAHQADWPAAEVNSECRGNHPLCRRRPSRLE